MLLFKCCLIMLCRAPCRCVLSLKVAPLLKKWWCLQQQLGTYQVTQQLQAWHVLVQQLVQQHSHACPEVLQCWCYL
jgi:hypothetical protein